MVVLSNFIVIVALGAKFVPETVTTVPAAPEVGESVIAVATTVNVLDAVNVPSVADMV